MSKSLILTCMLSLLLVACNPNSVNKDDFEHKWTHLIDKSLSKWDQYLSYKHQVGYDGSQPKDEDGSLIEPIGLNKPGYEVFTTVIEGDEDVIRISGEYYGCLISKNEYDNYHFQLKFKWGDKKWDPRKKTMKDSGILYHSIGKMGAEHWRSWMLSQEFQIMEGHTGDYWKQATSAIDIRAYNNEFVMTPLADPNQPFRSIGENQPEGYGYYCMRSNNYEKPHGEWNTLDLICYNGKSLHIVNGEVVMILENSRYYNEDDQAIPLTKGKIQIQSEAAEVFYKDIKIRKLDKLSEEHSALF